MGEKQEETLLKIAWWLEMVWGWEMEQRVGVEMKEQQPPQQHQELGWVEMKSLYYHPLQMDEHILTLAYMWRGQEAGRRTQALALPDVPQPVRREEAVQRVGRL